MAKNKSETGPGMTGFEILESVASHLVAAQLDSDVTSAQMRRNRLTQARLGLEALVKGMAAKMAERVENPEAVLAPIQRILDRIPLDMDGLDGQLTYIAVDAMTALEPLLTAAHRAVNKEVR